MFDVICDSLVDNLAWKANLSEINPVRLWLKEANYDPTLLQSAFHFKISSSPSIKTQVVWKKSMKKL